MEQEQVDWTMKQSIDQNSSTNARQTCTYSSSLNINKTNYPFSSSYEHQQTWTLTRTLSNHNKRYQSVIENIHLVQPNHADQIKYLNNESMTKSRSIVHRPVSILPVVMTSKKRISSSTRSNMKPNVIQRCSPTSTTKLIDFNDVSMFRIPAPMTKPMRLMHNDGELIIRI